MNGLSAKGWTRNTLAAIGAATLLAASGVNAATTFTGTSGTRAASVTFDIVAGNQLQVVLTNTSASDTLVPIDVLTAVFFDVAANPTLSKISGLLTAGSTVFYDADGQPAGGVIGGEWAYIGGGADLAYNANYGISSIGTGIFGPGNRFPGPDLQPPVSPNGLQYGLLSAGDNSATGNGGITGSGGLIKNSVTFLLGGFNGSLNDISNITFQYGTSLTEPNVPGGTGPGVGSATGLPEPGVLSLMGASLVLAGGMVRRRRKQ